MQAIPAFGRRELMIAFIEGSIFSSTLERKFQNIAVYIRQISHPKYPFSLVFNLNLLYFFTILRYEEENINQYKINVK